MCSIEEVLNFMIKRYSRTKVREIGGANAEAGRYKTEDYSIGCSRGRDRKRRLGRVVLEGGRICIDMTGQVTTLR